MVRNYWEEKKHTKKCFITLTYKEQPFFLVRKDVQDFIKRFRYEINKEYYKKLRNVRKALQGDELINWKEDHKNELIKVRIYYAGEYGTRHGRPHFHIIMYGWEEDKLRYSGMSKRTNTLYYSKTIAKCWKLGKHTYQNFNEHEAPYIALYNTPKEAFKKSYKMTLEKAKKIRPLVYKLITNKGQRRNLLDELKKIEKILQEEKEKYYLIKEFNGWSLALGWEKFEEQYNKAEKYVFTEYIENKQIATPSPWIKKLANLGDIQAAEEMFRREKDIEQSANEAEERIKNLNRLKEKRKKEKLDWVEQDRKNGETTAF